jgi:hypothetical protein
MGWEIHELFILKNDGSNKTRIVKNARLYRDRLGNLKNYFYKVV